MTRKSTEQRRAEISDALLATMAEHGYAKASIKRIAEEADVTPGLIHYHFDSKREILLHLLDDIVDRQLDLVEGRIEEAATPTEALDAAVETFLAAGESARPDEVAAWVTINAEAIRQPEVREALSAALQEFRDLFARVVAAGVEAGDFETGSLSTEGAAAALLSTVQGYFATAVVDRDAIPAGSAAPAARRMARGLLGLRD